ncbi:MAG: hypothetical protein DRO67_00420 [Candidatus Asgardarchaeum californiense]|nr:MAG: hypothetical protein DRO67_00420 [Candidatus Asgardarchaeum californiense]
MGTLLNVVDVGYTNVYDLEIEDEHNFFVDGICVHNSSSNPNF